MDADMDECVCDAGETQSRAEERSEAFAHIRVHSFVSVF